MGLIIFPDQHDHDDHDDHGGLHRDLLATVDRRTMLRTTARLSAGFGILQFLGCGDGASPTGNPVSTSCSRIPEETAGPFPGDGSNGANVLNQTGVVRNDIRSSFAGLNGTAAGVPLTVALTIVSASTCEALADYAVYLWHCDRDGNYSLYSSAVRTQNYLRGVQAADSTGKLTFTTVFPGCYPGRWPHIHFEVFRTLAASSNVSNRIATSQLALPKASCDLVYATTGYASSRTSLGGVSLAGDGIFRDGSSLQLATMTGNVTDGFTASLTVAVNV